MPQILTAPLPVDVHVGQRVRLARLLAGRSQEWLADKIGVSFQQLQKYESASNRISCSRLSEIAEALMLPVPWFFPEDGEQPSLPALIGNRQRQVYQLMRSLIAIEDDSIVEGIVAFARTISEAKSAPTKLENAA